MSYSEEKLLQFFGQLVGVAIRADVPIALDLLPSFWKSLKGETLSLADLKEADCITYHLTQKMLSVNQLLSSVFVFVSFYNDSCSVLVLRSSMNFCLVSLTIIMARGRMLEGAWQWVGLQHIKIHKVLSLYITQ